MRILAEPLLALSSDIPLGRQENAMVERRVISKWCLRALNKSGQKIQTSSYK